MRFMLFGLAIVGVVVLAAMLIGAGGRRDVSTRRPQAHRLGKGSAGVLWLSGMAAAVATFVLISNNLAEWLLVPAGAWLVIAWLVFAAARRSEKRRTAREHEQRERMQAQRAERLEEFGGDGVELLERATAAIDRIVKSEAAQTGWLGAADELDFTLDVEAISGDLRTAQELRCLATELAAIPTPTADDQRLLADAEHRTTVLDRQARERTQRLETCAEKAGLIDESLRTERETARLDEQHDDVRSRMAALLDRANTAPTASSESTDRVVALVAAYQEVRGALDQHRGRDLDR